MARPEKTVFISYRRKDVSWALAVYHYLRNHNFDVFFDYESIQSGDFEQIIVGNIKARAHFLLILTPTALDRCSEPGDWLRREIESAISQRRNIIPLFFDDFNFGTPSISEKLTGKLEGLKRYNGLEVPAGYFDEAMERLRGRYLNVTLDAVLHPVSDEVQQVVKGQQVAADQAIARGEEHEDRARKEKEERARFAVEEKARKEEQAQQRKAAVELASNEDERTLSGVSGAGMKLIQNANLKSFGIGVVALLILTSLILGRNYIIQNLPTSNVPTVTITPPITPFVSPTITVTVTPTETSLPIPALGVGSTMISEKDGIVMAYVPAGEFEMGSERGSDNKKHTVNVGAFWIDQTEVTNAMYAQCVQDRKCSSPDSTSSNTRDDYFGNPEFDDYPVIYVSWNDAKNYCEWADRRLPTEAEWEKAASWDEEIQKKYEYPWDESIKIGCSLANYRDRNRFCEGDTGTVGRYTSGKSPYGVYDMAGNVWEWSSSLYQSYPYDPTDGRENLSASGSRVQRGGSWRDSGDILNSALRFSRDPRGSNDDLGFRCSRDASP